MRQPPNEAARITLLAGLQHVDEWIIRREEGRDPSLYDAGVVDLPDLGMYPYTFQRAVVYLPWHEVTDDATAYFVWADERRGSRILAQVTFCLGELTCQSYWLFPGLSSYATEVPNEAPESLIDYARDLIDFAQEERDRP